MNEITHQHVRIDGGFWGDRLNLNAGAAIDHQWEMLEATGCIENFRIAAGRSDAFREGYFFADSDAYKWLEAACRIQRTAPRPILGERIATLCELIRAVQTADGYIYTYNQVHFPGRRWVNLPVEHELYCMGHLIEACVSHAEAFDSEEMLEVARQIGDLLIRDFRDAGPEAVCGHEEIEIALVRLSRATGDARYLDLARRFVARRGCASFVAWRNWQANRNHSQRRSMVEAARTAYRAKHGPRGTVDLPPGNATPMPRFAKQRWLANGLSGRYMQTDRPVSRRREPVGHAVRFGYLQAAAAMLERAGAGSGWREALEMSWDAMATRRMYATGGLGALPSIEGFGRDFELDPEYAYNETCAALASMLWAHEMALLTGEPKYADLFEWQLYNASLVGLGERGDTYFYNNPLRCRGEVARQPWFLVPCCPSNLARIWARLGEYLYAVEGDALVINQFVSNEMTEAASSPLVARMTSEFPWRGRVVVDVLAARAEAPRLRFRVPSWAGGCRVSVNGQPARLIERAPAAAISTAGGYSPYLARLVEIDWPLRAGDSATIEFEMPVRALRADARVGARAAGVTLARGPLVYCLESHDNPGLDVLRARLNGAGFEQDIEAAWEPKQFGGATLLRGRTADDQPFTAIPYFCWGNRGPTQVNVVLGG